MDAGDIDSCLASVLTFLGQDNAARVDLVDLGGSTSLEALSPWVPHRLQPRPSPAAAGEEDVHGPTSGDQMCEWAFSRSSGTAGGR